MTIRLLPRSQKRIFVLKTGLRNRQTRHLRARKCLYPLQYLQAPLSGLSAQIPSSPLFPPRISFCRLSVPLPNSHLPLICRPEPLYVLLCTKCPRFCQTRNEPFLARLCSSLSARPSFSCSLLRVSPVCSIPFHPWIYTQRRSRCPAAPPSSVLLLPPSLLHPGIVLNHLNSLLRTSRAHTPLFHADTCTSKSRFSRMPNPSVSYPEATSLLLLFPYLALPCLFLPYRRYLHHRGSYNLFVKQVAFSNHFYHRVLCMTLAHFL